MKFRTSEAYVCIQKFKQGSFSILKTRGYLGYQHVFFGENGETAFD